MDRTHKIEPTSTGRLLSCLGLAIDEAKLVRSLVQVKERAAREQSENAFSQRLICLNQEITYLEQKLNQVRHQARAS